MPVSESEKLGVGVLGCHLSEKAENVPFKKRKFMFISPSPLHRVPSPHCDEAVRLAKSQPEASDFTSSTSDFIQHDAVGKNLRSVTAKLDKNENFSGISTLAAASFGSSLGEGIDHVEETSEVEKSFVIKSPSTKNKSCSLSKENEDLSTALISPEGTGSFISVVPVEEPVATVPVRVINSYRNDTTLENESHEHSVQDPSTAKSEDLTIRKDEVTEIVHDLSSRYDRLHWDLNVYMEAWEHPSKYQYPNVADVQPDQVKYGSCSDKLLECKAVERETGAEKELELAESRAKAHNEELSNIVECKFDTCTDAKRTSCLQDNLASSSKREQQSADSVAAACKESSTHKLHPCLDAKRPSGLGENFSSSCGYLNSVSVDITSRSTDIEISASGQFSALCSTGKNESLCLNQKLAQLNSTINNSLMPEINHSTSICISETVCDQGSIGFSCMINEGGFATGTGKCVCSGLQIEKGELADATTLFGGLIQNAKIVKKFCDLPDDCSSPKDEMPWKLESAEDVRENVVYKESVESSMTFSEIYMAPTNSPSCHNPKEFINSFDNMPLEEPLKDACNSSESADDHSNLKASRFEVDYDSQYEEGEVRESIEHAWEEYDSGDIEAENGDCFVDHGMEHTHRMGSQPSLTSWNGKDASSEGDMRENKGSKCKPESDKLIRDGAIDALVEDMLTRTGNDSSRKNGSGDNVDKLVVEEQKKVVNSRVFRRGLRSCIEMPAADDALLRRKSDLDYSNPRCERKSVHGKSFGWRSYSEHSYARGRGFDSRDGNRGKRHHCHGSMSFRYPVPNGSALRHNTRSRSPDASNEAFGMRIRQSREFSPCRHMNLVRSRSERHGLQVHGRGSKSKFHGPLSDECLESSFNKLCPSANIDRSFSPIGKRKGPHVCQSHSKSLSRSQSPSPNSRNQWPRQQSKSPYFRSELIKQRVRSPYLWPAPLADYVRGCRPVPRGHGSPSHSTRLIRHRKDILVHCREQGCNQHSSFLDRRLPGRLDQRDDSFDLVDSPRSFRSFHQGICTEMRPVGGGGLGHELNDNGSKHGCIYGKVHHVKRKDMDGHAVSFCRDLKYGFPAEGNTHYRDPRHFHGSTGRSPKDLNGH